MRKFEIGQKVKFVTENNQMPDYYSDDCKVKGEVHSQGIIHGNTRFIFNQGTVEDYWGDYYVVSYISEEHDIVQVCFKEDVLIYESSEDLLESIIHKLTH